MCDGIEINGQQVLFSQPGARLPVRQFGGGVAWVIWGRRVSGAGHAFPQGGWAPYISIKAGKWKPRSSRLVEIPAERFLVVDALGHESWIEVAANQKLQGVLLEDGVERRVYLVTEQPPEQYAWAEHWPRLVQDPASLQQD